MLTSSEIARGSQGAVKFLWRDVSAPLHFDNTFEGCLHSFQVMILVAPIYALYFVVFYAQPQVTVEADEGLIVLVESAHYVVDWLIYPVLFYEIARWRGWLDRYPRYIAALNWINLPASVAVLVGGSLATIAPPAAAAVLEIGLRMLLLYWFIMATRLALGVNWPLVAALTAVNWVPSYFLSKFVNNLLGVGFTP
jgi:hypothetical protein